MKQEIGRTPYDALRLYSALTHFIGLLLSVAGLVVLIVLSATVGTAWHVVSLSIYGTTLVLLYTASTFYHFLRVSPRARAVLRRLDHCAIFLLIAGTYTPICLIPLRGAWGWSVFGVIWGLAVAGIVVKTLWITAPRWVSSASYLSMGWVVVVAMVPLCRNLSVAGLFWLFVGGFFYTSGAIMYALKFPRLPGADQNARRFGSHEYFHVFVLLGSTCHYILMLCMLW